MADHFEARYATRTVRVEDLDDETVREMASLYLGSYDGSSDELFRSDLAEKDEAILLIFREKIVGFTTLRVFRIAWRGGPVQIVYSGDTIVSQAHWGQQALAFAWIRRIGEIKRSASELPLFWFLLSKGHRTFKYLPVFGRSFYPHWTEHRFDLKELADKLAGERFGDWYDADTGIVKFPNSRGHLRQGIAEPAPEEMTKTAVRFFLEKNPGYRRGEEIVCICELETFNMKPLTSRIFEGIGRTAT